jgi:hypothetical protein
MSELIRNHKKATAALIFAGLALLCLSIFLAVIIQHWPFSQASSADRLQRALNSTVEIKSFRQTWFPFAGYVAEGVTFRRQLADGKTAVPFLTINKLTVQANYFDLLRKPHRLRLLLAVGAHIFIPEGGINLTSQNAKKSDPIVISELRVEQATLDVGASTHEQGPLRFNVHSARFLNVGPDSTVAFNSSVHIPEPPGEAEAKGWIGPWRNDRGSARSTPITGTYTLSKANLGHYASLDGILSSQGEFSGTLAKLNVKGTTTSPNFGVRETKHHFQVNTHFAGTVDLRNGDVDLPTLQASIGKTAFAGSARVGGEPKAIALNVPHGTGEVQDLILLFSAAARSPITGPIGFSTRIALPPGDKPFTQRVRLEGKFDIDQAHFTSAGTQQGVDKLNAEAQGEHSELAKENDTVSDLDGQVKLENGIARLSPVTFSVPGATANMTGTYSLLSKRVNFNGKMRMKATLSEATTGAKSVFLKVLNPFFKKKGAGAELPVQMSGIYGDTHFNVGLRAKK